jgi:hypothetical protein
MAYIVINDLDENAELDEAAMRKVLGGSRSQGFGLMYSGAQPRTLMLDRLAQANRILPQIGLGPGYLGSNKY